MTRAKLAEPADPIEAAKQFNLLENTLFKRRVLTIFGEINKDVAQRTAEKLLSLAYENDDPITIFIGSPGRTIAGASSPTSNRRRTGSIEIGATA